MYIPQITVQTKDLNTILFRPSLKSDVPEVGYMHWFSTLVNKHEKTTVLEFFHLYKQVPIYYNIYYMPIYILLDILL